MIDTLDNNVKIWEMINHILNCLPKFESCRDVCIVTMVTISIQTHR